MNRKVEGKKANRFINVRILCVILASLGLVCFSLTLFFSFISSKRYDQVIEESQKYLNTESCIHEMRSGIDYLNDQAKRVVNTTRSQYITSYFNAADGTSRQEEAYNSLMEILGDEYNDASTRLSSAYAKATALEARQIHAIRLIAAVAELPKSKMPAALLNYSLTDEEKALTPYQKTKAADELIDSDDYMALKASIDNDLDGALDMIKEQMVERLEESKSRFNTTVLVMRVCLILSFFDLIGILGSLFLLILIPMGKNISAIKHDEKMPLCKANEMAYMVAEYNALYEKNLNDKMGLKKKAEHDGLTGLLNRAAFISICENLKDISKKVCLVIVDVDDFKLINDKSGHEAGDNALLYLANILAETFRDEDYIVRYGGDEFVILMEDVGYEDRDTILRKLKHVNSIIGDISDNSIPTMSVSAGVAFSKNGYNNKLFESADNALYKVKANGKHGYLFAKS